MDSTAIERIEALAAAASATDHIAALAGTAIPAVAVPLGTEIKSLEHLQEAPSHQRATYTTERLADFCKYIKYEALADGTAVFVKPDGSGAEGVIDFGSHDTPLWGHHRASLVMKHTPEYKALLEMCHHDRHLDQRAVIDYLEDWAHIITPLASLEGDNTLTFAQAIQKMQQVDIKAKSTSTTTVGNFGAGSSIMDDIEAACKDGLPPAGFDIKLQVYPCTAERTVRARLGLKTGSDKPTFRLRIIGEESIKKEVAEEIDLEINTRLSGTDVRTFVGSVKKP